MHSDLPNHRANELPQVGLKLLIHEIRSQFFSFEINYRNVIKSTACNAKNGLHFAFDFAAKLHVYILPLR